MQERHKHLSHADAHKDERSNWQQML